VQSSEISGAAADDRSCQEQISVREQLPRQRAHAGAKLNSVEPLLIEAKWPR